ESSRKTHITLTMARVSACGEEKRIRSIQIKLPITTTATITQPLYMLRFPLGVEDRTDIFQDFVSPLIFAPVIGLGFWRFYKRYRSDDVPNSAAA
ncbi:MAG: hypothetical protein AAGF15_08970, partial [Pseudomonadota bacterium]